MVTIGAFIAPFGHHHHGAKQWTTMVVEHLVGIGRRNALKRTA